MMPPGLLGRQGGCLYPPVSTRVDARALLWAAREALLAELARRLEEHDYPTPFAGLADWHLLRALAIHRPDLIQPYVHLVDQEPFDEE